MLLRYGVIVCKLVASEIMELFIMYLSMTTFLPRLKAIEPLRWRTGTEKLFRRINSFALIRTLAYGNNAIIPCERGSLITVLRFPYQFSGSSLCGVSSMTWNIFWMRYIELIRRELLICCWERYERVSIYSVSVYLSVSVNWL